MPVTVAFDRQLAVGTATGIGVYQRDLALALRERDVEICELSAPWLDPWRFDRRVLWDQVLLPIATARSKATILHATAGTPPLLRTLPTIVTVHDVAWLRVQSHARPYARAYFGDLMRRLYRRAEVIVLDSAFSRDEFITLVGDRPELHVIYPGVDSRFFAIERKPRERPLFLAVGTVERRKNVVRAVEAIAAVPDAELVVVGPPTPYLDEVQARARELGVVERVQFRGYVSREELDQLYAIASAALVPSRYEGFGYAVAEALCAGLPVVAARSSSLVEVAATDACLVDPDDHTGWVEAIRAIVHDRAGAEDRAHAARARSQHRFGWARAAEACAALYARM
jgi:glycosyltransferase involved in cell wall biosynthesis